METGERIPEDVMASAKDAVFDFDCDWTADGRRRGDQQERDAVVAIARTILAERERCAKIAEEAGKPYALHKATGAVVFRTAAEKIAEAIRA